MIGQSKTGGSSHIIFITHSSLAGAQLCCAFYQPQQTEQNMQEKNHFPEPHGLTACARCDMEGAGMQSASRDSHTTLN